jgi:hypothetical protein
MAGCLHLNLLYVLGINHGSDVYRSMYLNLLSAYVIDQQQRGVNNGILHLMLLLQARCRWRATDSCGMLLCGEQPLWWRPIPWQRRGQR